MGPRGDARYEVLAVTRLAPGSGPDTMAMAETNCSTGDSRKTTEARRTLDARRLGWALSLGGVSVLLLGVEGMMIARVKQLENSWATVTEARLNAGIELRETLHRLDDAIFRFRLTEDPISQDRFAEDARKFAELVNQARTGLAGAQGQTQAAEVKRAFEQYLSDTKELMQRGVRGVRRETPALVGSLIRDKSRPLQDAVERLAQAEREAIGSFLVENRESLQVLRRSTWLSGGCVMVILSLTAFLIYRGIMPPRQVADPQTQAALMRQERLASLGVLAAGVAHEIRNPLTALKLRLYSLKKALPPALADHEDLGIVSKEINRLERIVKDFLEFARPSEPKRADVPAGPLLQEVHELLRAELDKRGIQVRLEIDPTAQLWADRQQLQQILINLLQNAAESTPAGGTITLGVRQGVARLLKRTQPMVMFEVIDTGKGIPPEAEPRIFDPFFSTKEGGSGLGLSIAARIAELHGGHIQFATRPGRGTTFTVVLPKTRPHESKNSAG